MSGYLVSFTVYTAAMCGLIFFALFVYKKFAAGNLSSNSRFLNVEDALSLGPRKTLYVIKAGNEKFLIASDMDKTSLISKLDASSPAINERKNNYTVYEENSGIDDLPVIVDFTKGKGKTATASSLSNNVIKSMIKKIKE